MWVLVEKGEEERMLRGWIVSGVCAVRSSGVVQGKSGRNNAVQGIRWSEGGGWRAPSAGGGAQQHGQTRGHNGILINRRIAA